MVLERIPGKVDFLSIISVSITDGTPLWLEWVFCGNVGDDNILLVMIVIEKARNNV
jgi:hypothetical protein